MTIENFYQIDFEPIGKRVEVPEDTTLLEAARQAGIELASACGGNSACGQCQVVVLSGDVSEPVESEYYSLTDLEIESGYRLACCTQILGDVKVQIPKSSLITDQRLQIEANDTQGAWQGEIVPIVQAFPIKTPEPTLEDLRADTKRISDQLIAEYHQPPPKFEPEVISQLSPLARAYNWKMNVFLRHNEVLGIAPQGTAPLGMAVDLGTTKLAAKLINLENGQELAITGAMNPQIGYGEDVISRLTHAHRNPEGLELMSSLIRASLDEMLGVLVEKANATRDQVVDACIVGNTAMTHLLLALPVKQLVTAPYIAATNNALDVKARSLGFEMAPGAYVHIPPCIGGFVGADHVAMILASGLDHSDKITLGIDIGTNTEIALRRPGEAFLSSISCASGPAFEGAHISDGMRAASGAIEKVKITGNELEIKTVNDVAAVGLCGSGIVDAISELYRSHLINYRGRFDRQNLRIRQGRHGPEFLLVPASESGSQRDVLITQEDVNQIQLAKGAIRGGLEVLLEVSGTPMEAVQEVVIAGAFGSYLDINSVLSIGLFPNFPNAVFKQIGNAAVEGAKQILISQTQRQQAREIAENTKYFELTTYKRFRRYFAEGMLFPNSKVTG